MSFSPQYADRWVAISPSDSNALTFNIKGIYVGTGGSIVMTGADDEDATFANVGDGAILPCNPRKVKSTGTTASGLIAIY